MHILSAERKHIKSISEFQVDMANETESLKLDPLNTEKGVTAIFDDPSKGEYLICEIEGKIVGCLLTLYEWSDWRNGHFIWVHSVYVKPEFRKKGIYKKLYEKVQSKVKNNPEFLGIRLYVDKRNNVAHEAYKSLGMTNEHYELFEWME